MKRVQSIRARLLVLVLTVALPLLALIAYNTVSQVRTDAEEAHAQASRAARVVAADTEQTLARTRALLLHLSKRPLVQALDEEHCDPIFSTFGGLFPQYTNLLTIRRDAARVCSAVRPPADAPAKVDPSLYLTQTLQSRSFTVGQATRGIYTGRWILLVAHPLVGEADPAGELPGIVAVSMDLASLPLAPSLRELPPGTQAQIVDARGIVLGSSMAAEQTIGVQTATTLPKGAADSERIYGSAPISGTTWQARVGIPSGQVYDVVKRRAATSAAVAMLVLSLATLLAFLIARRIARPIEAIAAAARRASASDPAAGLGPGIDFAARPIAHAPREVRELAKDFGQMLAARLVAEHDLRDSEQSLATTLHSIGDAVIATDRNGRIRRMNASAQKLTAWSLREAAGRPLAEVFRIVDARSRVPAVDPVHRALERGGTVEQSSDTVLLGADGREFHITDSAAPIRDAGGQILGVVLVFSDVTPQYRTQQALRERQEQLRTITDMLPGPVSHIDREGRYRFANAAHQRWFGHRAEDVVGRLEAEIVGAQTYRGAQPYLDRVRAGERVSYEATIPSVTEGPLHALVTLLPDRTEDGSVQGHFAVAYDITERKRAEEALRRSEERLQLALRGSRDAPWDWNMETGEWFYSDRWWQMIGRDEGGVASDVEAARNAVHPDDRSQLEAAFDGAIREGREHFEAEFRLRHRDGHDVPVLSRGFILRDAAGQPKRISGLNTDLTERKRAEAERSTLEAQLRESQKMESIGTLAGGIAHDFNNILGGILGNVVMAREDIGPGHQAQHSLQQITKASLRARHLVEQILAFSYRRPQVLVDQPLRPLVEETMALLRSTLPARVELKAELSDAPLSADADGVQIQQMLVNVCTNAWHALQDGTGFIEVGLEAVDLDAVAARRIGPLLAGRHAHLWVRDNGCGMDEATRHRIFEPFFTTKPVGQGTGLGLAVVHGIAAAHHGAIAVDSVVGSGTTFHLYLPATQAKAVLAAPESVVSSSLRGSGERVLYVDDDEVMLVMVERLLQRSGFEVTTCLSAKDAIDRIADPGEAIDVVVTDFNMPEFSGLDIAQQTARTRPSVPVVIVSGSASEELSEEAQQAGAATVLKKQNAFEELAPLIQHILARKPQREGAN